MFCRFINAKFTSVRIEPVLKGDRDGREELVDIEDVIVSKFFPYIHNLVNTEYFPLRDFI